MARVGFFALPEQGTPAS